MWSSFASSPTCASTFVSPLRWIVTRWVTSPSSRSETLIPACSFVVPWSFPVAVGQAAKGLVSMSVHPSRSNSMRNRWPSFSPSSATSRSFPLVLTMSLNPFGPLSENPPQPRPGAFLQLIPPPADRAVSPAGARIVESSFLSAPGSRRRMKP